MVRNAGSIKSPQYRAQCRRIRQLDRETTQSRGSSWRGAAAATFPGVKTDVMMVTAGADEERTHPLHVDHDIESQDTVIEIAGPRNISDAEVHVSDPRSFSETGPWSRVGGRFIDQRVQVERIGRHLYLAVAPGPRIARSIAVDLDAVVVGIGEIERFADELVRGAAKGIAGLGQSIQRT